MVKLRPEICALHEVQPDLRELMGTMRRMSHPPPNFTGRQTASQWLQTLGGVSASHELEDDQVRQMLLDLESAYSAFHHFLHVSPWLPCPAQSGRTEERTQQGSQLRPREPSLPGRCLLSYPPGFLWQPCLSVRLHLGPPFPTIKMLSEKKKKSNL